MKGEIIAIGNELTSGRVYNTTSGFAARHLFDAGYEIYAIQTIGDSPELIGKALKQAIQRVDFVIVTGGLGSTDDDLTNEAVSAALNRPARPDMAILSEIHKDLAATGAETSPLEKLAWLPEGAQALSPQERLCGYQLVQDAKPIFFLPGIPGQTEYLLLHHVLPRLASWYADPAQNVYQKLLRLIDIEEFEVNRKITELHLDKAISIGYYPVFPELHLTLTVRGLPHATSSRMIATATERIRAILGDAVYGEGLQSLEKSVGLLLLERKMTLALAESCTGGLISSKITKIPGSSAYYLGGVTSYSNEMKMEFLQIDAGILAHCGAVSKEVAEAMAGNLRRLTGASVALSVTGIAGPDGGTEEKPVGTVYIGLASAQGVQAILHSFNGSRKQIQKMTAATALNMLRRHLLEIKSI